MAAQHAHRTLGGAAAFFGFVRPRCSKDPILAMNLVKRTLTNLYNERPAWPDNAHQKLDAVFAACDWEPSLSDEILEKLLALNLARAT